MNYKKKLFVEVKANTQGSMQSLWIFMRKRQLHEAIRTSLENFGQFDHYDPKDNFEHRHVDIVPLYALSNLELLGYVMEKAPHSSALAWQIPWTEEPGGLPSMGSRRVGHN